MPTYVYMSTSVQSDISIKLVNTGPDDSFWGDFKNPASSLPKNTTDKLVLTIDRGDPGILDHTTVAELQFSVNGQFVVALEVMLSVDASPFKSFICWAWRTPLVGTGSYETDYNKYSTVFNINGWKYEFSIQGKSTVGFDDIYISLTSSVDRSRWMEALKSRIIDKPLNEIRIPGSHDSGTSSITVSSPWAPDSSWWHSIARDTVARWSKTQSKSVGDQLLDGIRYFDLRVAPASAGNDSYVLVHALEGDNLESSLDAVKDFLVAHEQEIIILDFNHFYNMQPQDHSNVVFKIHFFLNDYLIPPTRGVTVTPRALWNTNQRVVVAYADDATVSKYPSTLWPRQNAVNSSISSPNPNTNDIQELHTFLTSTLNTRTFQKFFILQSIMAPGPKQVVWPGYSLQEWAQKTTNPAVITWIQNEWSSQKPNIIMTDFYEESDIIGKVINLNM